MFQKNMSVENGKGMEIVDNEREYVRKEKLDKDLKDWKKTRKRRDRTC